MVVNLDNGTVAVDLSAEECLAMAVVQGEGGELMSGLWYVGVIMSILSSIASNLGVNIQKLSMMRELTKMQMDPEYRERPYIFQRTWLIGLLLVIGGSVGDFAALGFAAQSLATPVGGFTMVANVFFAHFFLKEHLGCRDVVATILVICGVVMVAASADKTEKTYSLECLLKLYQRAIFIYYVAGIVVLVFALFMAARWLNRLRKEEPEGKKYKRWRKMHPIFPAALSGLIGAQSVLFAKCSAELIKKTLGGENQFLQWETYVIILCMFFTIFNQLHWLATGLKYFDAVLIIPVFQCFFITGGVIGGGVFFDEFSGLKVWEQAMFSAGVGITIFGVFLLSQRDQVDTRVTPEGSIGDGSSVFSEEGVSLDSRPATPMPMSLQYHSLAMQDVYQALRDSLSTPDRNGRRMSTPDKNGRRLNSRGEQRQIASAPLDPHIEEEVATVTREDLPPLRPSGPSEPSVARTSRQKRQSKVEKKKSGNADLPPLPSEGTKKSRRKRSKEEIKQAW